MGNFERRRHAVDSRNLLLSWNDSKTHCSRIRAFSTYPFPKLCLSITFFRVYIGPYYSVKGADLVRILKKLIFFLHFVKEYFKSIL